MIDKRQLRFKQLQTVQYEHQGRLTGCLYGLDENGRVWKLIYDPYLGGWEWERV